MTQREYVEGCTTPDFPMDVKVSTVQGTIIQIMWLCGWYIKTIQSALVQYFQIIVFLIHELKKNKALYPWNMCLSMCKNTLGAQKVRKIIIIKYSINATPN